MGQDESLLYLHFINMSRQLTDLPDGVQATIARKLSSANAINYSMANKALRSVLAPVVETTHYMGFKKRVTDLTKAVSRLLDSIDKHVINEAEKFGGKFAVSIKFVVKDIIISAYIEKDCSETDAYPRRPRRSCDTTVHVSYYNYDLENGISIKLAKRLLSAFLEEVLSTQPLLEQLQISVDMTMDFASIIYNRNPNLQEVSLAIFQDISKKTGEHLTSNTKIVRQNEKNVDLFLQTKTMKTILKQAEEKLPTLPIVFSKYYPKIVSIYESLDAVLAFEENATKGGARKKMCKK